MDLSDAAKLALVKLKLAASEPTTGAVAMGPRLFDTCVSKGWVARRDMDGYRFGYVTGQLSPFAAPVFSPPDLADWDFRVGEMPHA